MNGNNEKGRVIPLEKKGFTDSDVFTSLVNKNHIKAKVSEEVEKLIKFKEAKYEQDINEVMSIVNKNFKKAHYAQIVDEVRRILSGKNKIIREFIYMKISGQVGASVGKYTTEFNRTPLGYELDSQIKKEYKLLSNGEVHDFSKPENFRIENGEIMGKVIEYYNELDKYMKENEPIEKTTVALGYYDKVEFLKYLSLELGKSPEDYFCLSDYNKDLGIKI